MTGKSLTIYPADCIRGETDVARDKSIAHRAVILGSLAAGESRIDDFYVGEDNWCTVRALRALSIDIVADGTSLVISGRGLNGLKAPEDPLDLGNSGTGLRLLAGVLAAQPFDSQMVGDASLSNRPMDRIVIPLSQMGAEIAGQGQRATPPLTIIGHPLSGITYQSPIASAQVKSAILLAGLFAQGTTQVVEPHLSRNHTETMLAALGAHIESHDCTVTLQPVPALQPFQIRLPGDPSAAAFAIAAAAMIPNSHLTITGVGTNSTRTGFLDAMIQMGGQFSLNNPRSASGEPVADIEVQHAPLKGTVISGELTTRSIDELIILATLAATADGVTEIRDAAELRVKESDRIQATCDMLTAFGVETEAWDDGFLIKGQSQFKACTVASHGDHRIAMAAAILALRSDGPCQIEDSDCIATSFPGFNAMLERICER